MDAERPAVARGRRVAPEDVVDVFVYVVVLNLAAQYVPQVITESFSVSILTAVMLKVVLEVVLRAKKVARARLRAASGSLGRLGGVLVLWAVLAGSKFLVLAIEDLLFGDRVELGGFVAVTGLVLALITSREGVRRLLAEAPEGDSVGPGVGTGSP